MLNKLVIIHTILELSYLGKVLSKPVPSTNNLSPVSLTFWILFKFQRVTSLSADNGLAAHLTNTGSICVCLDNVKNVWYTAYMEINLVEDFIMFSSFALIILEFLTGI